MKDKKIKLTRKLVFKKETIVDLDGSEMKAARGGDINYPQTRITVCLTVCPSGYPACVYC